MIYKAYKAWFAKTNLRYVFKLFDFNKLWSMRSQKAQAACAAYVFVFKILQGF